MLGVKGLISGYGKRQVPNGVDIDVPADQIVAVIGHNGAGKSTLLKAIFGLIPVWEGDVQFAGNQLRDQSPRQLLKDGLAYVPQGNRVFGGLTVRENLVVGGVTLPDTKARQEGVERALTFIPVLRDRLNQRAGTLSGGEKQMVALGNALVLSPKVLLLDEPSLGLSPPMITSALQKIKQLSQELGVGILIVEQKVREVLTICDRVAVIKVGKVAYDGPPDELRDNQERLREVFL